jgi:ankyrin repeat protein
MDTIDVNSKDKGGGTLLSWAAAFGHKEIVELLLAMDTIIDLPFSLCS